MRTGTKWLLAAVIIAGIFLRLYHGAELFNYSHDQDLAGWIIKDVLVNHHFRLIGQLTSTPGVFIGPLFYYLLIPFYLLFKMDPIGGIYLAAAIGAFAIWSCYYVFSKIFNEKVGLISALIYAISPYTVFNDREVVPTMPLMLWSVWFFYSLNLILKGEQKKGFLLGAILIALIWHINFGLVILLPLYLIVYLISRKKLDVRSLLYSLFLVVLFSLPLIFFEARHGFSQTKSIIFSATQSQGDVLKGFGKVAKIFDVVIKDVTDLVYGYPAGIPKSLAFWIVTIASLYIFIKGKIQKNIFLTMTLWMLITAGFFALYSKPVSEYYLNSMTVVWIALMALIVATVLESKKLKYFGYIIITLFTAVSFYRFFTYPVNHQGYVERKAVVDYIKKDAVLHNYPCVAVSYIVSPGYNLGYRWFFYLDNISTRPVLSNAPVYSITFPLSLVDKVDKTFGSIGVINPDYKKYNENGIKKSCEGKNFNLTDSMFGYTQ